MRKSEIRKLVSERAGLDLLLVDRVYNAFLSCIREALLEDEVVLLTGIGRLYIEKKPERQVHDNLHGQVIVVPERRYVKFRSVGSITDELNSQV